jgi:predicted RNase H-like nuclease
MIIGVDGCRSGWLGVIWDGGRVASAAVYPAFSDILELEARFIAVDMPIGFPERAQAGGRACEQLARKLIGLRRSSVFSAPARITLSGGDYAEASKLNRAASDNIGISSQAFNIFPKIREIDALMTPDLQSRLAEVHPEVSFRLMKGQELAHAKKKAEGRAERRTLLEQAGFPLGKLASPPKGGWGEDDVLDACACAWSALRLAQGKGLRLPEVPEYDARGLRMEICG